MPCIYLKKLNVYAIPKIVMYIVFSFYISIHIYYFSVADFVMALIFSTGNPLHLRNITY